MYSCHLFRKANMILFLRYCLIILFIGAPSKAYQLPECCVQGVALGDNYTLEVGIISNPYPLVTSQTGHL